MLQVNSIGVNQTIIGTGNKEIFFSYKTPVAICEDGVIYKTEKKFSKTTSKHINNFIKHVGINIIKEKSQEFFNSLLD